MASTKRDRDDTPTGFKTLDSGKMVLDTYYEINLKHVELTSIFFQSLKTNDSEPKKINMYVPYSKFDPEDQVRIKKIDQDLKEMADMLGKKHCPLICTRGEGAARVEVVKLSTYLKLTASKKSKLVNTPHFVSGKFMISSIYDYGKDGIYYYGVNIVVPKNEKISFTEDKKVKVTSAAGEEVDEADE